MNIVHGHSYNHTSSTIVILSSVFLHNNNNNNNNNNNRNDSDWTDATARQILADLAVNFTVCHFVYFVSFDSLILSLCLFESF